MADSATAENIENIGTKQNSGVAVRRQNQMRERKCGFCPVRFKPKRMRDRHQNFCCDNCRKDYFRYGGPMPPQKMMERTWLYLEERVTALIEKLIQESREA